MALLRGRNTPPEDGSCERTIRHGHLARRDAEYDFVVLSKNDKVRCALGFAYVPLPPHERHELDLEFFEGVEKQDRPTVLSLRHPGHHGLGKAGQDRVIIRSIRTARSVDGLHERNLRNRPGDLEIIRGSEFCATLVIENVPKPPLQFEPATVRLRVAPAQFGIKEES